MLLKHDSPTLLPLLFGAAHTYIRTAHARTKATGHRGRSLIRSSPCSCLTFSLRSALTCVIAKPSASFRCCPTANSTISASPASRSITSLASTLPRKFLLHCNKGPSPPLQAGFCLSEGCQRPPETGMLAPVI